MASLWFSSFNQRTTPELDGRVSFVSADITQDQKTGNSFYTGRISGSDSELMRLGEVKLIAGMPVEAFVKATSRHTICSPQSTAGSPKALTRSISNGPRPCSTN